MAFGTLNRLKWTGRLSSCSVVILHRGAPGDRKVINGGDITELKKSCFTYSSSGRECTIPLHRVLEIRADGDTLWRRRTKEV
jgi:uncharacterized protein (UPF0248 family)